MATVALRAQWVTCSSRVRTAARSAFTAFQRRSSAIARRTTTCSSALDAVLSKTRFWQRWAGTPMNERQVSLLNRLLDGLEGKLTSSKWAAIAKCSPDTALRDINELMALGVLRKTEGGGRSTGYELAG